MSINRRSFLRGVAGGGAVAAAGMTGAEEAQALQRTPKPRLPEAIGLLYDSTLCVGCKACVSGCKQANDLPAEIMDNHAGWNDGIWDTPTDLSADTFNIIKVYQNGTMETKDSDENGYAFIKRQCFHCVDPSCISACPVTALTKNSETGIVEYDADRCIGCRYCVYACPFGVPKYEYNDAFGEIRKCELCRHKLAENELPGCVEHCPTGATLFGKVEDLYEEGKRRTALEPGDVYAFPMGDINGNVGTPREPHEKVIAAKYQPEVYGEKVLGGTQTLYVSAVSFDKLGLPYGNVPDYMYSTETEGVQHTLYRGMVAPVIVLSGLVLLARRTFHRHHHEVEEDAGSSERKDGGRG